MKQPFAKTLVCVYNEIVRMEIALYIPENLKLADELKIWNANTKEETLKNCAKMLIDSLHQEIKEDLKNSNIVKI